MKSTFLSTNIILSDFKSTQFMLFLTIFVQLLLLSHSLSLLRSTLTPLPCVWENDEMKWNEFYHFQRCIYCSMKYGFECSLAKKAKYTVHIAFYAHKWVKADCCWRLQNCKQARQIWRRLFAFISQSWIETIKFSLYISFNFCAICL